MPGIKRKVKVKKIPEGPRDPSLSATFRPGKVKGRSRKKLLTGRKLGGAVKRKTGGTVRRKTGGRTSR